MERLTFVDEDGLVLFDNPAGFPEDIGFTIRELAENEEWEALDNIGQRLANCEQKLKYYEDLEKQRKLLKLPCAVGDTVYSFSFGKMLILRVDSFIVYADGIDARLVSDMEEYKFLKVDLDIMDFGKKWFATHEEAEAALKAMDANKGQEEET